jgi:hypothetical protein
MIWNDTIKGVYEAIVGASVFNAARSTTPANLGLVVLNQAKDWLCMYKPWRDLRVKTQITPDSNRKVLMPDDFGCIIHVFSDPSNTGKPQYYYTLNDNDIALRYDEEVSTDADTGAHTRYLVFPSTTYLPSNPYVVYSKVVYDYTAADVAAETKRSFFPKTIMLVVAKKIFQDYYGVPANQDPNWINNRVMEELRMLEGYAYNTNVALDMAIKDRFSNPVFIGGMPLSGNKPLQTRPSPFLPSTLWTGGTT